MSENSEIIKSKISSLSKISFLTLIINIFFAFPAFAEKRLAVLPFDVPEIKTEMKQFGIGTADSLTIALSNIKEFIMIDRSQFQSVLKEQAFQNSGFSDTQNAVKLGKLLGAEILIMGSIQFESNTYRITAKLTEVETGKIIKAVQVTGNSIFELQDKLAEEIINTNTSQKTITQPQEGVLSRIKKIFKSTTSVTAYDYYLKGRDSFFSANISGYQKAISYFDKALEIDKNYNLALSAKAESQALLASELEMNGKAYKDTLETAYETAIKSLENDFQLAESHRALSTVYKIQGKFEDGKKEANKALELNPNDAEAYYLLWSNGDKVDINNLNKALSINPVLLRKIISIGYAYFKQSKYKEAGEIYEKALKLKPDYYLTHTVLGFNYYYMRDLESAYQYFNKAIELNPKNGLSYTGLGLIYFKKEKLKEAISYLNKAISYSPEYSFAHTSLGYVYYAENKKEEALLEYKTALEINPDDFYARNAIGFYYFEKGLFDEALDQYKTALGINYNDVHGHYNIGNLYKTQGKLQEAVDKFNESLKIYPEFVPALIKLGEVYEITGNIDTSLSYYEKSVLIEENNYVFNRIGVIYYQKKNYSKAIENYKKALTINQGDAYAHNNLGSVYFVQGKLNEALIEYQEAVKADPNNISANENLGMTYQSVGKKDESLIYYKKSCMFGSQSACDVLGKI